MKTRIETVRITHYISEVCPEIDVTSERWRDVIVWADETPNVWDMVRGTKSKPFGRNSSTYLGSGRGMDPEAICYRASVLASYLVRQGPPNFDFFAWRARFSLEHYRDKGFRGGFFQQWDGEYMRGCQDLDYTPSTRDEVIARFVSWCDEFKTREVWIDKNPVKRFK